jgi:hypothetical protein
MKKIDMKIEKSKTPIIWLDTSIISKIAKYKLGLNLNQTDIERIPKLYNLIIQKVKEKKLLCPEAYQVEELELFIQKENNSREFQDKCHEIINSLSLGTSFHHHEEVKRMQMQQMMKTFCRQEKEIHVNYRDIYIEPEIGDFLGRKVFLSILPSRNMGNIYGSINLKKNFIKRAEAIRKENLDIGLGYEEVLENEYNGPLCEIENVLYKNSKGIPLSLSDKLCFRIYSEWQNDWDTYGCSPNGFGGLIKFLESDYYKAIPFVEISSKLYAKKMTSPNEIQTGDRKDFEYMSIVIPYCDYVITDRKIKNLIKSLNLDTKYKTRIFCLKDFEEFFQQIEKL